MPEGLNELINYLLIRITFQWIVRYQFFRV